MKKARLRVIVTTGVKENKLTRFDGQLLGIRISAPPTKGRANRELINFLSLILALKKDDIVILTGYSSRSKTIAIRGLEQKELEEQVHDLLDKAALE